MKMNETKTKFKTRMLQIKIPSWGSKSLMAYRLCAIGQGWLFNGFLWSQLPPPLFTFFGRFHHDPSSGCKLSPQQKFSYGFLSFRMMCMLLIYACLKGGHRWLWLWWCLNNGKLCKFDFSWELNSIPGWNWIWFGLSFHPSLLAAQSAGLGGLCWTHE